MFLIISKRKNNIQNMKINIHRESYSHIHLESIHIEKYTINYNMLLVIS